MSGGGCARGGREDARRDGLGLLARRARATGGPAARRLRVDTCGPRGESSCQVSGDFSVAGGISAAGDVLAAGRLPWRVGEPGGVWRVMREAKVGWV